MSFSRCVTGMEEHELHLQRCITASPRYKCRQDMEVVHGCLVWVGTQDIVTISFVFEIHYVNDTAAGAGFLLAGSLPPDELKGFQSILRHVRNVSFYQT